MKIVITPRRHAVPVKPGERPPTPEENSARIAAGRRAMVTGLLRRFPQARIVGIQGQSEILVDLPDSEPHLPSAIRAALDVETGPAPGEGPPSPERRAIEPTAEAVAEAHAGLEYRPTVVAVIRDGHGRVLMVQSVHDRNEWMFIQGGIEPGESPLAALGREIGEEIGVGAERYAPGAYVGTFDLDAEGSRTDKRGFTKGKRYFIYEVAWRGPEELRLQASELAGYEWIAPRFDDPRLLALLSGMRVGKGRLLIAALARVI